MSESSSTPPADWPSIDFLLALRADQEAGRVHPLGHYLARDPQHEVEIAREYLLVRALEQAPEQAAASTIGPFRLLEELGHGGEGTVHLAHDALLGRNVALKVLTVVGDDLAEARVLRAAAMAARLDHPHLARVFGAGRHGRQLWVAMQYIEGTSLAREVERRRAVGRRFSAREVAAMLAPVARALQHAHDRGVVHRDVKPSNLLVRRTGGLVLADFGLARDGTAHHDLTATGELRGTPCYMAPERLRGGHQSPATDVYALGVVAYELATLVQPFRCVSQAATIARSLSTEVWCLPDWSRLPTDLQAVLAMAMAKDLRHRYADAAAFAADLEHLAAGEPVAARPPGPFRRVAAFARREPALAASLGLVGMMLVASCAFALLFLQRERALRATAQDHAAEARAIARSIVFDHREAASADGGAVMLRAQLVQKAVQALERLAKVEPNDRQLKRELCLAWLRLGDVHGNDAEPNLRDLTRAASCCDEAERIARTELTADPRQSTILAAAAMQRGNLAGDDFLAAAPFYRAAIEGVEPDDRERRTLRAAAMGRLAMIAREAGELDAARLWIEQSEREFAVDRDHPHARGNLLATRTVHATILAEAGDVVAAERVVRAELATLAVVSESSPWRHARQHAQLERVLANVLLLQGRTDEGMSAFERAIQLSRQLLDHDRSDRGAADRLVDLLNCRAVANGQLGATDAVSADRSEAAAIAARAGLAKPTAR